MGPKICDGGQQSKEIKDTISYHNTFGHLKQYQNEVNDIRAWQRELSNQLTPLSGQSSKEDSDPEQAYRDKDMQKNGTHAKYFKSSLTNLQQQPFELLSNTPGTRLKIPTKEVLPEESSSTEQPLEQVQNNDENNVYANERQHSENNTAECVDERAALAILIANLILDTEENKTILKQLKKENASLTQELKECRTNLDETGRALREATSCRDSCLIALQNK
ncbi:hypothetical protein Tco_0673332 [Tanacetum coccineum]